MPKRPRRIWVLLHHHAHGVDVHVAAAESEDKLPDEAALIAQGGETLEEDKDEWTEWVGPFDPEEQTDDD